MLVGLVGAVLPLLPGAPLIWLGAFLWAWADGFTRVGWLPLLVMACLAMLCWASDILMTTITMRLAGGGWSGVGGAIVGGLLGALVGLVLGIIGTVPATILGAVAGILTVEYRSKHNWRLAARAAAGYIAGYLISSVLQLGLVLLMIAVFLYSAFR